MLIISRFEEFTNLLQGRLHLLLSHYEIVTSKHSLIINMLDRSHPKRIQNHELITAGLDKQRELLNDFGTENEPHWQYLKKIVINKYGEAEENIDDLESPGLFVKLHNHQLDITDIQVGNLCDYFNDIPLYEKLQKTNYDEKVRKEYPLDVLSKVAEYHIFKHHFDLNKDKFLSIPLIQFGHFDGLVHILFSAQELYSDVEKQQRKIDIIKKTIRFFSVEYENLLLDWPNKHSAEDFSITMLQSDEFWKEVDKSPIFKALKYKEYYRASHKYYEMRIRLNEKLSKI